MESIDKFTLMVQPDADGVTVIRLGEAPKLYDPVALSVSGNIHAPAEFFKSRKMLKNGSYFNRESTIVLVNRNSKTIELRVNESDKFRDTILGSLKNSQEYKDFGLNTDQTWTASDLAKFLKRRLHLFPQKDKALELISSLKNSKTKVTENTEKRLDDRGGKMDLVERSIETDIPLCFTVVIPLFDGFEAEEVKVEICLDKSAGSVVCMLESIETIERMEKQLDEIIDSEIAEFKASEITVIEV